MDFLQFDRVWRTLSQEDVVTLSGDDPHEVEHLQLDYAEERPVIRMLFGARQGHVPDVEGAEHLQVPRTQAGALVEAVLHKLHLTPLLAFPIGRWRPVFNAVSPVLTDNDAWMELDSTATIKLNTRDPLEFELRDFHMLKILIDTILEHTEELGQGISLAATSAPLLIEVESDGGVLLTIGNESLAMEIRAVAEHLSEG
ncbi:MAG: hypothetical protein MK085_06355 [Phycisphaerales bacterium]|nr:hypothetical protein [Phycisphaerales bacterium]